MSARRSPGSGRRRGAGSAHDRLRRLARSFGLAPLGIKVLLIGPDPRNIDLRFKQLYGYLNDDVTRRRASIGLAFGLCRVPEASAAAIAVRGGLTAGRR
ncbi:MAG: hypothetical protein ACRDRE_22130 [Pseudonocardiaceae bacterium]